MSVFKEIPPTAGLPLYLKDFFPGLNPAGSLGDDLQEYLGLDFIRVTYSGTAALYLILESLKALSSKATVIIPSYVCPLVPLAIKRAGFKVEVCDIGPDSFDFNLAELEKLCSEGADILALVVVHLGGIPADFTAIEKVARKHGIFIIEDCAQALGAEYQGRKVGSLGDFSFFSLCRGKGLTIYEGGIAATAKKEYAPVLEERINALAKDAFFSEGLKILELFGYWIFYRAQLFWFAFRLPQMFWNLKGDRLKAWTEYFTVDFPIHKVSRFRESVGHAAFARLEKEINRQRDKAGFYLEHLKEARGIKTIKELPQTKAVYPYLTLVFQEAKMRDRALQVFQNSGLGVSLIYTRAIGDYDYLKGIIPPRAASGGRYLAKHSLSLSTSTFLKRQDLETVAKIIKDLEK